MVTALRASGGRRRDLRQTIINGNNEGGFLLASGAQRVFIPVHQLLRDVSTRWSSTHMMVNRTLEQYPVSSIRNLIWKLLIDPSTF